MHKQLVVLIGLQLVVESHGGLASETTRNQIPSPVTESVNQTLTKRACLLTPQEGLLYQPFRLGLWQGPVSRPHQLSRGRRLLIYHAASQHCPFCIFLANSNPGMVSLSSQPVFTAQTRLSEPLRVTYTPVPCQQWWNAFQLGVFWCGDIALCLRL